MENVNQVINQGHLMRIGAETYPIVGDSGYLGLIGDTFEPSTVNVLHAFCSEGSSQALDIGANLGLTALALSQFCDRVVGVEPISKTFAYLQKNVETAGNVRLFKYALGKTEGTVSMQGHADFLAGAYIADEYTIPDQTHFTEQQITVKMLDKEFQTMGLDRLDFMKIDVEGFELDVFDGGRQVIGDMKPVAFLEMNHWCLNVFRRISIPEFRERLLDVFPFVFALDGADYLDYGDPSNVHRINHGHVVERRYNNLVAGFDRNEIIERLESVKSHPKFSMPPPPPPPPSPADTMKRDLFALQRKLADESTRLYEDRKRMEVQSRAQAEELQRVAMQNAAILRSTSWKVTAPLRAISKIIRR